MATEASPKLPGVHQTGKHVSEGSNADGSTPMERNAAAKL